MSYTAVTPPFESAVSEWSKQEWKRYFQWFLGVLPQRIDELATAVRQTPGWEAWEADDTPHSLDTLSEWFAGQIDTRRRSEEERDAIKRRLAFPIDIPEKELTDRTLSLAMDIGMYFSQVLFRNHPSLTWEQPLRNKRLADYGQPVITGFAGGVPLNPVRIGRAFANGLASGTQSTTRLREVYEYWVLRVRGGA